MFITRATRRDRDDLTEFYSSQGWDHGDLARGVAFIAREGAIVGAVRLVETEPNLVVVDDVVVREDRRGTGIGKGLVQAAMNSRGGTLYLVCHPPVVGFYGAFGFEEVAYDSLPEPVKAFFEADGDAPHQLEPGHEHVFLKAR